MTRDRLGKAPGIPRPLSAAVEQWLHLGRRTWVSVRGRSIVGIGAVTMRPWCSSAVRVAGARLRHAVSDITITWPPSDTSMIWSACSTGKDATSEPLRSLTTMAVMPLPPRPDCRYS